MSREEGKSAYADTIRKRPAFKQLLDDSESGEFNTAVVHALDRWARNTRIALESLGNPARNNVALVSNTENIDYSTAQGKLLITMLAGSDMRKSYYRVFMKLWYQRAFLMRSKPP